MAKTSLNVFRDLPAECLVPLEGQIVVEIETADCTQGGILLPDQTKKEQVTRGKILAIGPGRQRPDGGRFEMPAVAEGDRVILNSYGGQVVEVAGDRRVKMCEPHHLLARIDIAE